MAPESGGKSREEKLKPSEVILNPLQDSDNTQAVKTLLKVIQSSIGPCGKTKLIHNGKGGHVTCTSTCSRILQNLAVSNRLLQLLLAPVQNHIKAYHDGGLFSLLLAVLLADASCKLIIHKHLLVDIYEVLLERCLLYLASELCLSRLEVTFENTENLIQIVSGVLGSKTGCCLTAQYRNFICKLVVEGFLKTFSDKSPLGDNLLFIGVEGRRVNESKLLEGVIFETPHIPAYKKEPITVKSCQRNNGQHNIKVALFDVSLSGDVSTLPGARYEVSKPGQVEEAILENLMNLGEQIKDHGVGLVFCQKVVHPKLKKYWKHQGILVLDRLGNKYADYMIRLSGCVAISSTDASSITDSTYGWLSEAVHQVIQGKSYIHLTAEGSTIHTLLLCNFAEEPLQELMHACSCARQVLNMTLRQPQVLQGGGCWQASLALHIQSQVMTESVYTDLDCSRQQWIEGATTFCHCIAHVAAIVDKGSGLLHAWMKEQGILTEFENAFPVEYTQTLPPDDCMIENKPVLDVLPVCQNALRTAITAANMFLSVGVVIKDSN